MVRLTLIARVIDGLPLAASMEDEQTDRDLAEYKQMAKMLFKKLNEMSPTRQSLETHGPLVFHYAIESGVCYLVLCDKTFPANLAFAYLDELQTQFQKQYGAEINTVARPYAFIAFDTFIQKTKRNYLDTRGGAKGVSRLNNELRDVQRIMMQNIDDVLGRGEKIDSLGQKASNLKDMSRKYAQDAKDLNWKAFIRKYGPVAAVAFVVLIMLYVRFF